MFRVVSSKTLEFIGYNTGFHIKIFYFFFIQQIMYVSTEPVPITVIPAMPSVGTQK